jgi:branched-chain amino acid transport system substrate-binding protein
VVLVMMVALGITLGLPMAAAVADMSNGVIRIAVLSDFSGIYKDLAGEGSAVAAGFAIAEQKEMSPGLHIELLRGDHQNSVAEAVRLIRQWQSEPGGLDAVVDVPNSAVALAVQEIARQQGLVHLNVSAAAPELTGRSCTETGFSWVFSTTALANSLGHAVVNQGYRDWYFLTADYVFGHRLEADAIAAVYQAGGSIRGVGRHPFGHTDFTAAMQKARASGASVIALADAGDDMVQAVLEADRSGLRALDHAPRLVGLLTFLSEVHKLGAARAQGMMLVTGWYWNRTEQTRAFAARFHAQTGRMPTMTHAAVYSAVGHYLAAVRQSQSDNGPTVARMMRSLPVQDLFTDNGILRSDGRLVHDLYLAEVKSPKDMTGEWDYYRILETVSGETAFPLQAAHPCAAAAQP